MKLTQDITLDMLTRSGYAKRHGINNAPNEAEIENLKYLAKHIIQPIYDRYNIYFYISSGFRNSEVEKGVGGSNGLHLFGCAADLKSSIIPLMEILTFIYNNLPFTELIAEYFPDGWVHAGIIKGREEERKLKLKDANHHFTIVEYDYLTKLYGRGRDGEVLKKAVEIPPEESKPKKRRWSLCSKFC